MKTKQQPKEQIMWALVDKSDGVIRKVYTSKEIATDRKKFIEKVLVIKVEIVKVKVTIL